VSPSHWTSFEIHPPEAFTPPRRAAISAEARTSYTTDSGLELSIVEMPVDTGSTVKQTKDWPLIHPASVSLRYSVAARGRPNPRRNINGRWLPPRHILHSSLVANRARTEGHTAESCG
jgi:hypothetical protein